MFRGSGSNFSFFDEIQVSKQYSQKWDAAILSAYVIESKQAICFSRKDNSKDKKTYTLN